ncbi:MAG: hypothetical protein JJT81_10210 [Rubellimicrobium sp.]|nr:hypothetical protein [Rubellimicrobium sp.]
MRLIAGLLLFSLPGLATAEGEGSTAPLSAIDWLSSSVESPPAAPPLPTQPPPLPDEPPVASDATSPEIVVTPLDRPSADGVGLLPSSVTGLPRSLWAGSDEETLVTLVRAERAETMPALQELIVTLMLAEADPPRGAGADGRLFLARIDRLLDIGALEPAQAMLEQTRRDQPEIFRRWFDISLLTGTEDNACDLLRDRPVLAPTYPVRIFCLARTGEWMAAALTLNTARALGEISDEDEALLTRFLDPELFEGEDPLPPPSRPSPLVFRLREAIGEPLPIAGLPRAFAHADLRSTAPWRNRIEAAERLARFGSISENLLFGLYTERRPAASGGVWDRAAAIQALEAALADEDREAVARSLPSAFEAAEAMRIEVPFARIFAERLLELDGPLDDLVLRVALLSPLYEAAVLEHDPTSAEARLWSGIARGDVEGLESTDPRAAAVIAAFAGAAVPEPMAGMIAEDRLGEALLRGISAFHQGLDGDPAGVTDALAVLRAVGLEEVARKAALQYLLLDRPT